MSENSGEQRTREEIAELLKGGLETAWEERADDAESTRALIQRLRTEADDLSSKLRVAGFTSRPVEHRGVEQACANCMYYLVHNRYCILPELDLPVEPEWSCSLWRI